MDLEAPGCIREAALARKAVPKELDGLDHLQASVRKAHHCRCFPGSIARQSRTAQISAAPQAAGGVGSSALRL